MTSFAVLPPAQPTNVHSSSPHITAVEQQVKVHAKSPQITATALLEATPHEIAKLRDIHELLCNLFARNKNQHRRSHWWKSLHALRKQMGLLIDEFDGKKSEREDKIEARLRYWDNKCIHQWYWQFSQLVSIGSFAVLGMVLMACIARVCRITGITSVYEDIASQDIMGVLSANDELAMADEFSCVLDEDEQWEDWDEGVLVMRSN